MMHVDFTFLKDTVRTCTVWNLRDSLKPITQGYLEYVGQAITEIPIVNQDCIAALQGAE